MDLQQLLVEKFGYETFREGQQDIIESVLNGHDTLALLPTGMGKSLCYQLPGYVVEGTIIIISPLLSLMQDQVEQLKQFGEKRVAALNSFLSAEDKQFVWQHFERYRFLFLSPEMLASQAVQQRLAQMKLGLIVVDEAHCISQWGFDFRPEYLQIATALPATRPPILALSATATKPIIADIERYLNMQAPKHFIHSVDRKNLHYEAIEVAPFEKAQRIIEQVTQFEGPGILYTQSRKKTVEYASMLQAAGIQATYYHGGMEHQDRQLVQHQFMQGEVAWICATNAFGMGIHKQNIRQIIHDHFPQSVSSYMQEVGRAGRDGKDALVTLYYEAQDAARTLEVATLDLPTKWHIEQYERLRQTGQLSEMIHQGMITETAFRVLDYWMHQLPVEQVSPKIMSLASSKKHQVSEVARILTSSCIREALVRYFDEVLIDKPENCCTPCGVNRTEVIGPYEQHHQRTAIQHWQERLRTLLPIR